jgi:hypothetical protein
MKFRVEDEEGKVQETFEAVSFSAARRIFTQRFPLLHYASLAQLDQSSCLLSRRFGVQLPEDAPKGP